MSERWIQKSERVLNQLKDLENVKDRDRLELVRSMRVALNALAQSLNGWMQWLNNPDVISMFNQEELEKMNKTVMDLVTPFIEYDIKVTNEGIQKGIKERRSTQRRSTDRVFYV
jgi:hypothetical protein